MQPIPRALLVAALAVLPGGVLLWQADTMAARQAVRLPPGPDLLDDIMGRYAGLAGFSAEFVQEIRSPHHDTTITNGAITTAGSGRMTWWMTGASGGRLTADGETLWAWPASDTVVYRIDEPSPEDTTFAPLDDLARLTERFAVDSIATSATRIVLSLTPHDDPDRAAVTMVLDRGTLALSTVRWQDPHGQVVLLRLSEVVLSPSRTPSFVLSIPDGVSLQRL